MTLPTVDISSDLIMVLGLIGFFTPLVIAFITQSRWSSRIKSAVLFIWCLVIGLAVSWFTGKLDPGNVVTSTLIVFTFAIAFYAGLWKQLGITDKVSALTDSKKGDEG